MSGARNRKWLTGSYEALDRRAPYHRRSRVPKEIAANLEGKWDDWRSCLRSEWPEIEEELLDAQPCQFCGKQYCGLSCL